MPPEYFERLYARDPDPWRFASSAYEAAKYEATLAALGREHYATALEVGCSIGVLTERLAPRCGRLLAIDVAGQALARARARCAGLPWVSFARARFPAEAPAGRFGLVLLSEVLYYLDARDIAAAARWLEGALAPGAELLLVHWTGATDYPLSGDAATDLLLRGVAGFTRPVLARREERYRLDLLRRTEPPAAAGAPAPG